MAEDRQRRGDTGWAKVQRYGGAAALAVSVLFLGNQLFQIGGSVTRSNDLIARTRQDVRDFADRNCQVSAAIERSLRATIASEITNSLDRTRVLALFPPIDCSIRR